MIEAEMLSEGPLKGMRKRVSDNLGRSWANIVPATVHASLAAEALGSASPINAYDRILRSIALALAQTPAVNATFDGEIHRTYAQVNLGFAVDTPHGLTVPVIHDAARLGAVDFATCRKALSERVRQRAQTRGDLSDGTFSVSNLGPLGIEHSTPVTFGEQVAILGLGAVQEVTRRRLGEPAATAQWLLPVSLTFNHRVVDGADAARFLKAIEAEIAAS